MTDDLTKDPPHATGRFIVRLFGIVNKPVTFFREKIVEPNQSKNKSYYFHRRFRRVPSIDECDINDSVCFFEANEQFKRDKLVDNEILSILRQRRIECMTYYGPDTDKNCKDIAEDYETAATNWFIKYGDIGAAGTVKDAYMKQKHRLIWERRHGPVGSGTTGTQNVEVH